jgi:uncharacterized membrane protein
MSDSPRSTRLRGGALRLIRSGTERLGGWSRPRLWVALGACFLAAVALAGLVAADLRDPPNLVLFVGRFHPMIVHFPIGLILLAALLEALAALHRPFRSLRHATAVVLFLGAVGAVLATVAGYFLSLEGGYDPELLERHMWMGIGVAAAAVTAAALKIRSQRSRGPGLRRAYVGALGVSVGTLLLAGHVGGSISHGEGYLTQYMPAPMRSLIGSGEVRSARARIVDIDSAFVYQDLIAPVLAARCVSCHSGSKVKGGLRLDTADGVMEGGDGGSVVIAGDPDESELLRRITLSPSAKGAMPPDGARPLDVGETELIRWWIAHGA